MRIVAGSALNFSSQKRMIKSRGEIRPCWALIYNHYKTKGLDAYYTKQFMDGMVSKVVEDITEAQVVDLTN